MNIKIIIVAAFVLIAVSFVACDELPIIGGASKMIAGSDAEDKVDITSEPNVPEPDDSFMGANKTGSNEGDDGQDNGADGDRRGQTGLGGVDDGQGYEYPQEPAERSYCGDGVCDDNERCDNCKDCACSDKELCYKGRCAEPECMTDEDCADDDGCTVDRCEFAGHPNAYCSDEVITERNFNDGCCPEGAYLDVDSDCVPVCGDGRCEFGEDEGNCLEDCEHYGEHNSAPKSSPQQQWSET